MNERSQDELRAELKAAKATIAELRAALQERDARIKLIADIVGETKHPLFQLAMMGWKGESGQSVSIRKTEDGDLFRTSDGRYVLDHPHGPTEVTAVELAFVMQFVAQSGIVTDRSANG